MLLGYFYYTQFCLLDYVGYILHRCWFDSREQQQQPIKQLILKNKKNLAFPKYEYILHYYYWNIYII